MKLEEIGFYTLNDKRAISLSATSPMQRCEMILTGNCNFSCPYCRGFKNFSEKCGTISRKTALMVLDIWIADGLKNVRFSGGEPTLYPHLFELVERCKKGKVSHIAVSSNGSAEMDVYKKLIDLGVNDFSISLDACCSSYADRMAGVDGYFNKVVESIKELSKLTYVTVGVVLNEANIDEVVKITSFADELGVADIRLISSAQYNRLLEHIKDINDKILDSHPILKYRINNAKNGKHVRGILNHDCHNCFLVVDDSVVAGNGDEAWHFPCVINLREGGKAIGRVGKDMRKERIEWFKNHNSFEDRICRVNCLDVCQDYNHKCKELNKNF
jgi:molybdenum cofactor biosynthesis enzyme MoaA